MSVTTTASWQEDFEERLYDQLERETDPAKVRVLMETIATGRTPMSEDGRFHGNNVDPVTFSRLARTQSPVVEHYRERLRFWGADPDAHPMEPYAEWALRFGCDALEIHFGAHIVAGDRDLRKRIACKNDQSELIVHHLVNKFG